MQDENSDEDDEDEIAEALAVAKVDGEEESITTRTQQSSKGILTEISSFKSVITTRGQKLRETSTVSASLPPPPRDSREPSVSSSVPPRHSSRLRRTESNSTADSALNKAKGGSRKSPLAEASGSGSKPNEKGKAGEKVGEKEAPAAKVRPPGPNCMTCWGPLPPELVEEILAKSKGKGKNKAKPIEKDCFRFVFMNLYISGS